MIQSKLPIGVVGCGVMGRNHIRVLSTLPHVELRGIVEADPQTLRAASDQFKVQGFAAVDQLIAAGVKAVVVATPTITHHALAMKLLDAGIHVLVEKPIARSIDEAKDLIAKAEQKKLVLSVGHIERFNPAIGVLKKEVRADELISIAITRVGPFPPRIDDVGIIIDLGVHDIDLVRWICGSEIATRQVVVSRTRGKLEDIAFMQFKTQSGVLAHINTNWLTPFKERRINVATTKRFLSCDMLLRTVTEYSNYQADGSFVSRNLSVPFGEPLRAELEAFVGAVAKKEKPPVTGEDGLKVLELALACLHDGMAAGA